MDMTDDKVERSDIYASYLSQVDLKPTCRRTTANPDFRQPATNVNTNTTSYLSEGMSVSSSSKAKNVNSFTNEIVQVISTVSLSAVARLHPKFSVLFFADSHRRAG